MEDAPTAYLDAVKDAVCSCNYPRCFAGELKSQYEITNATGGGMDLKSLVKYQKIGSVTVYSTEIFSALENKLKRCCKFKTDMYIHYARKKCGAKELENVCATPNGYEGRFDGDELGADKHFPRSPCISAAWSLFETMKPVDKNKFVKEQAQKIVCEDNDEGVKRASNGEKSSCAAVAGQCQHETIGGLVRKNCPNTCGTNEASCTPGGQPTDVQLDDVVSGKAAMRHGWAPVVRSIISGHSPTVNPTEPPLADQGPSDPGACNAF